MGTNYNLQDWVGRKISVTDYIDNKSVKALAFTLNYRDYKVLEGNKLPELWFWIYFLPIVITSDIGKDGHPKRGGFLPPVELGRRMWAGSRINFKSDLFIGEKIEKSSEIINISEKEGQSGKMVFVTVKHQIYSNRGLAIEEEQDIVYVNIPKAFVTPNPKLLPTSLSWQENYPFDSILLFRFSAITFNSHKIHYDRQYALEEEKYPGLLLQGPLQALLLLESAKKHCQKQPLTYSFRGVKPLFEFEKLFLCGQEQKDNTCNLYTANGEQHIGTYATVSWR